MNATAREKVNVCVRQCRGYLDFITRASHVLPTTHSTQSLMMMMMMMLWARSTCGVLLVHDVAWDAISDINIGSEHPWYWLHHVALVCSDSHQWILKPKMRRNIFSFTTITPRTNNHAFQTPHCTGYCFVQETMNELLSTVICCVESFRYLFILFTYRMTKYINDT